jgi:hypothetical protein
LASESNLLAKDLDCVTESKIEAVRPFFVQVKNENGIEMAILYGQILRIQPRFINSNLLNSFLMWLTKVLLRCKNVQLLVLGHLFRHDEPYMFFSENINVEEQKKIVDQVIKELEKHFSTTAIFLKDLPSQLGELFSTEYKYNSFKNDVGMDLKIKKVWKSFADYELALKHKYVQRLRKTQKAFSDVVVRELSTEDVELHKLEIYNLYLQVCKNQNITLGLLNPEYFVNFKRCMDKKLLVHGFYYNNKLVAFSTAILKHNVLDMNYIGFDYAFNGKLQLYFNMLFYFVEKAIDLKCEKLFLGRTALEAKAILGCTPVKLYGYYKINNGLLARITNWFTTKESTEQGELWQGRHPFKSEFYE